VHTRARTTLAPIWTRPIWRLGRNLRLVRRFEWLTLCPYCGDFPQISHFQAIVERGRIVPFPWL
jgi:hypothetical protein